MKNPFLKFTQEQADYLLQLATHLETGKLGHEIFNFDVINTNGGEKFFPIKSNACGAQGCAMGELPILFPDQWEFDGSSVLQKDKNKMRKIAERLRSFAEQNDIHLGWAFRDSVTLNVSEFFQMDEPEIRLLFYPWETGFMGNGPESGFGISSLPATATKEEVASNIRKFVAWKLNQIEKDIDCEKQT